MRVVISTIVFVTVFIIVVVSVVSYKSNRVKIIEQATVAQEENSERNSAEITREKIQKLAETSKSLTVQVQTPELRAMLEKMSRSLNTKN